MRVAIDATIVSRRLKGAGRVVKNLVLALPRVDDAEYIAMAHSEGADVLRRAGAQRVVEVPEGRGLPWELRGLGQAAKAQSADAVLTLREIVGFGGPPTLLHIAEPPAYRLRSGTGRRRPTKYVLKDRLLQSTLRGSVRRAAQVTVASHTTAEWLHTRYGVDAAIIPPGIDPIFLEPARTPSVAVPYFLHPATGDRRDNTALVLRAFALLRPPTPRLVLMGMPRAEQQHLAELVRTLGINEKVEFVGWVSDARLRELYSGAIALVHPSSYEGFAGLQPLEAMAQGTPVVALDAPGATEALEGAAALIHSQDPEELAEAMRRLATDEAHRTNLTRSGRSRVAGLTWDHAATLFARELKGLS